MTEERSRECTVCVRSEQRSADGEKQIFETRSEGRLSERGGVLYVLYTEKMEEGQTAAEVKSLLKIEGEPACVRLKRSGAVSWNMLFEQGTRHVSEYRTPYGALSAGVETKIVTVEKGQEKTSLLLAYALFIQGEKQADCRLEIEIL